MSRDEILERNLRKLFQRAYAPVVPRAGYHDELARRLRSEVELATRPTSRHETRSARAWPRFAAAAAAAALVALGLAWSWWSGGRGGALDPASILSRGEVAVRDARGGWRALDVVDGRASYELAGRAELRTPNAAIARVGLGSEDTIELAPSSSASVAASDDGDVAIALDSGALTARKAEGGSIWTLKAGSKAPAEVAFEHGELALAIDPTCPTATLRRGRARRVAESLERGLPIGERVALCDDVAVVPGSAALAEGERAPVASAETVVAPPGPASAHGLRGVVVDAATGAPIDDFQVILVPPLSLPEPEEPDVRYFEASRGAFAIDGVEPRVYTLWVRAASYAPARFDDLELGAGAHELDVRLERGVAVRGRVLDKATGLGIANAMVVSEADTSQTMLTLAVDEGERTIASFATTDAQGAFVLEHLRSASTVLRATAAEYAPAWIELAAGDEARFELEPAARIRGRVEREADVPAPDALIVAVPTDLPQRRLYWAQLVETDSLGEYVVGGLPVAPMVVLVVGPEDKSYPFEPQSRMVALEPGLEARVDFLARRVGRRIVGRVVDSEDRPLAGRSVTLWPADATEDAEADWRSATVRDDGTYEFADVDAGSYELFVSARLPMDAVSIGPIVFDGTADLTHDARVGAGSLRCTLIDDASGKPLGQAIAILGREISPDETDFAARVLASPNGSLEIPFLGAGRYIGLVIPFDGSLAAQPIEPFDLEQGKSHECTLRFGPGATLDVVVRNALGEPVEGARIVLLDSAGRGIQVKQVQRTGKSGKLGLGSLPPGKLRLRCEHAGFERFEREIELAPGAPLALEIALEPATR